METAAIRIDGRERGGAGPAALLAGRLTREMEEEAYGYLRRAERLAGVLRAARVRQRSAWGLRPAAAGSRGSMQRYDGGRNRA